MFAREKRYLTHGDHYHTPSVYGSPPSVRFLLQGVTTYAYQFNASSVSVMPGIAFARRGSLLG